MIIWTNLSLPYPFFSFLKSYVDTGPHGNGRYIEHMLPEVEKKNFRKGSQVIFYGCYVPLVKSLNFYSIAVFHHLINSFRGRVPIYYLMPKKLLGNITINVFISFEVFEVNLLFLRLLPGRSL